MFSTITATSAGKSAQAARMPLDCCCIPAEALDSATNNKVNDLIKYSTKGVNPAKSKETVTKKPPVAVQIAETVGGVQRAPSTKQTQAASLALTSSLNKNIKAARSLLGRNDLTAEEKTRIKNMLQNVATSMESLIKLPSTPMKGAQALNDGIGAIRKLSAEFNLGLYFAPLPKP